MTNPRGSDRIKLPPISSITNFDDTLTLPPQTAPILANHGPNRQPDHHHHHHHHHDHRSPHGSGTFPFVASASPSQQASPLSSPQWPPAYHSQPRISPPVLSPPHNMSQLNSPSFPHLVSVEPHFPLQYYQQPQQQQQQQQQYPPVYYQQPELFYQQGQQGQQAKYQRHYVDPQSASSSSSTSAKPTIRRRTRTGCLTCRKRRVKCDERKPFCYNCERSRKVCAGYENPASTKFRKHRKRSEEGSTDASNTTSPEMGSVLEPKRSKSPTPPEQPTEHQSNNNGSDNENEQRKHEHLPPKVGFLVN